MSVLNVARMNLGLWGVRDSVVEFERGLSGGCIQNRVNGGSKHVMDSRKHSKNLLGHRELRVDMRMAVVVEVRVGGRWVESRRDGKAVGGEMRRCERAGEWGVRA